MRRLLFAILGIFVSLWVGAETKPVPRIEYPRTADYLIAELDGKGGYQMVRMEDFLAGTVPDCPGVQVFGDGRAVVCDGGQRLEMRLSEVELDQFIKDLLALGVHEIYSEDVAAKKLSDDEERFRKDGAVVISVDAPTYELKLNLDGYAPIQGRAPRPVAVELTWHSVSSSARHYPGNEEIQQLAAVERLFGALTRKIQVANDPGRRR